MLHLWRRAQLVFTAAVLAPLSSSWAATFDFASGDYVPDEILVQFKDASSRAASISSQSGEEIEVLDRAEASLIRLPEGQTVEDALAEYGSDPNVAHVQPNYIYRLNAIPNDALFSQMWGLRNTGQTVVANPPTQLGTPTGTNNPGTSEMDMNLVPAWDVITDCSSVTVGVIDSGITYNHQDLAANVFTDGSGNHGHNFIDNNDNPLDLNGHGTHVAGTIGAVGNNGLGTTGICWKAKIMGLRTCDAGGSCTTARNTMAVDYAIANGVKVINLSLGGASLDPLFSAAVLRASNADIVVVVAAGNEGVNNDTTPHYPCNFDHPTMLCVAALDQAYALAGFSNYGAMSVHVGAPGVNVLSTWAGQYTRTTDDFHSVPWTAVPGGAWVYQHRTNSSGQMLDLLVDPATYPNSGTFQDGDRVYKQFSLASAGVLLLDIAGQFTLGGSGTIDVWRRVGAGDPTGAGGIRILQGSGSTPGVISFPTSDITQCAGVTCSLGFRLNGPAPLTGGGAAMVFFSINALQLNNVTYNIIAGTSMATPHVAGLATMLRAYNPKYTALDVINAVKNGGTAAPALANKTTSGKAANALGSLAYINPPTGVTAAIVK